MGVGRLSQRKEGASLVYDASSFFISITAPPLDFYPPHTPYKQPPEAWSLPLIPHYRKTHL